MRHPFQSLKHSGHAHLSGRHGWPDMGVFLELRHQWERKFTLPALLPRLILNAALRSLTTTQLLHTHLPVHHDPLPLPLYLSLSRHMTRKQQSPRFGVHTITSHYCEQIPQLVSFEPRCLGEGATTPVR